MNTIISTPDLLWKDLFTEFHQEATLFFFGKELYDAIDFSVEPEFLEQEFNDVFTGNNPTKKIADKVIKYRLKNGQDKILILHAEFQGGFEKAFPERMFWYFIYIAAKYKTTDITALVIYTNAKKPRIYDRFKVTNFGTELSYKFNTYIVRNQNEAQLLASESLFSVAVLASLYLIKAGKNNKSKYEYKKKLVDIAITKQFDRKKLSRLLIFVRHLVTLPKDFENDFKSYIVQPKMQKIMEETKESMMEYPSIYGKAINEIRQESEEKGIEKGIEKGMEIIIMNVRRKMGLSPAQIADLHDLSVEYVQSVIDKYENKV
jgi:DNA-binding transcriptional regulator YiaG